MASSAALSSAFRKVRSSHSQCLIGSKRCDCAVNAIGRICGFGAKRFPGNGEDCPSIGRTHFQFLPDGRIEASFVKPCVAARSCHLRDSDIPIRSCPKQDVTAAELLFRRGDRGGRILLYGDLYGNAGQVFEICRPTYEWPQEGGNRSGAAQVMTIRWFHKGDIILPLFKGCPNQKIAPHFVPPRSTRLNRTSPRVFALSLNLQLLELCLECLCFSPTFGVISRPWVAFSSGSKQSR
jgi:hypothetical protein